MVFPYRVKNPPARVPYVTFTLIALNVLIFALTVDLTPGDNYLQIREDCVQAFAVTHTNLSFWRLISAMFLHGSISHIAGNMWFLWLFGPSVEGRLKPLKFTGMYVIAGIFGGLLQDVVMGIYSPNMPSLGASGAIMGLSGAYLYAFPYALFRVFRWWGIAPRIDDWEARWVVLYFFGFDLLYGMISHWLAGFGLVGGVGHFAHIGGAVAGFLFMAIARVPRDNEDIAAAQAMNADLRGDYEYLSWYEIEALMQHQTEDMRLVLAYCDKALLSPGSMGEPKAVRAILHYLQPLAVSADPRRLASLLLRLSIPAVQAIPSIYFLRLGSGLEQMRDYDMALRVYRRIWEANPRIADSEVALLRIGRMMQHIFQNADQARYFYSELIRTFPEGPGADEARHSIAALPYTETPFR